MLHSRCFKSNNIYILYLLVTNIILNLEKLWPKSCHILQNIRTPSPKNTREKNLLIGGQKLNVSQRHNDTPKQNKSGCGRNRCAPFMSSEVIILLYMPLKNAPVQIKRFSVCIHKYQTQSKSIKTSSAGLIQDCIIL